MQNKRKPTILRLEPIEKAVAKALEAKKSALESKLQAVSELPDEPLGDAFPAESGVITTERSPRSAAHGLNSPTLSARETSSLPSSASDPEETGDSNETDRREEARRQLFPSPSRSKPRPPQAAPETARSSADKPQGDVAQRGPNGSLAAFDHKKLDELVSQRLEKNPQSRSSVADESNADSLHVLRLIDREFGNWERAIRQGSYEDALASQTRARELQQQIPTSMGAQLNPTMDMLSKQTQEFVAEVAEEADETPEPEPTKGEKGNATSKRHRKHRR